MSQQHMSYQDAHCVCTGSLYCCIVACTHLGNSTGHKTVTLAAPLLLLASGPVRYEAELDKLSGGERRYRPVTVPHSW